MPVLLTDSRWVLHAAYPRRVGLSQMRFTLPDVTNSRWALVTQVFAHAGRTQKKPRTRRGSSFRPRKQSVHVVLGVEDVELTGRRLQTGVFDDGLEFQGLVVHDDNC